jgi:hypothetical protein
MAFRSTHPSYAKYYICPILTHFSGAWQTSYGIAQINCSLNPVFKCCKIRLGGEKGESYSHYPYYQTFIRLLLCTAWIVH